MIIVWNSTGNSNIAELCSFLLILVFSKWQNLLKFLWLFHHNISIWVFGLVLILAVLQSVAELNRRSFDMNCGKIPLFNIRVAPDSREEG